MIPEIICLFWGHKRKELQKPIIEKKLPIGMSTTINFSTRDEQKSVISNVITIELCKRCHTVFWHEHESIELLTKQGGASERI